jgi:putative two-component system response regulator
MAEKKNILLVDDDEVQHQIAANMLSDTYNITKPKSGKEALAQLCRSDYTPDLVLLDILMPDMDGWEVFNQIKGLSLLKNIKIAFLTSVSEMEEEKKAFSIGAVDFIKKPYVKEDMLERIEKILGR